MTEYYSFNLIFATLKPSRKNISQYSYFYHVKGSKSSFNLMQCMHQCINDTSSISQNLMKGKHPKKDCDQLTTNKSVVDAIV